MRLILASTSPRRRDLLALLGIPFDLQRPSFEERVVPGRSAVELVQEFAHEKARSVAEIDPEALVIGSDTMIELDGEILGKPRDLEEASTMLRRLAGRGHLVHTAVTVLCPTRRVDDTRLSSASVRMKPYDADLHERYLATQDSLGKAGGYSIQGGGADLIEALDGDYPTVVGLPLRVVAAQLCRAGLVSPVAIDQIYRHAEYQNWTHFRTGREPSARLQ